MKIERQFEENEWVKEITGKEFRESGALWFVNSILHLFGMAITWNPDTDELKASIVRYRGFDNKYNDKGYKMLSNYLKDNIIELEKDCD
jgi:hypothetical protein